MTPLERSFLDAILADPTDDTSRLIYADWLEESATDPVHAALIRTQIELAGYKREACPNRPKEKELGATLAGYKVFIKGQDCGKCRWCQLRAESDRLAAQVSWHRWRQCLPPPIFPIREIRRGFLTGIQLSADAWIERGEAILRTWPIERVEVAEFQITQHAVVAERDWWGILEGSALQPQTAWIHSWLIGPRDRPPSHHRALFGSREDLETAVTAACFRTIAVKIGAFRVVPVRPGTRRSEEEPQNLSLPALRRVLCNYFQRHPAPTEPRGVIDARRLVK